MERERRYIEIRHAHRRHLVQIYSMTMSSKVSHIGDSCHVMLGEFLERLGKATTSNLFNLVPRQLGEQLLELEADIRQMYTKQKDKESEQKELANKERISQDRKDLNKKVEVVDLLDGVDLKEEEVKVEVEEQFDQVEVVTNQMEFDQVEVITNQEEFGQGGDSEEVEIAEKEPSEKDLGNLSFTEEKSKREIEQDVVMRVKAKEKTEKCDICEKMFSRKCALQRHKVMHSKVYLAPSCPFCGKLLKGSIRRHILSRHPNKKDQVLTFPRIPASIISVLYFQLHLFICFQNQRWPM